MTMTLNPQECIVLIGLGISGCCILFLMGNYGVKGNFDNSAERAFFFSVIVIGTLALLITALWKAYIVRGEMKQDQLVVAQQISCESMQGAKRRAERASLQDVGTYPTSISSPHLLLAKSM